MSFWCIIVETLFAALVVSFLSSTLFGLTYLLHLWCPKKRE